MMQTKEKQSMAKETKKTLKFLKEIKTETNA